MLARADIQKQVEDVLLELKDQAASPAAMRRLAALRTAYNGLDALESGLPGDALTWRKLLADARDSLDARLKVRTLGGAADEAAATFVPGGQKVASLAAPQSVAGRSLPGPHELEYGSAGAFRTANLAMKRQAFAEARDGFEEMADMFQVIGQPGNKFAREAVAKLNEADGALRAARQLTAAAKGPRPRLRALDPIGDQEIAALSKTRVTSGDRQGGIWEVMTDLGGRSEPKRMYLHVGTVGGGKTFRTRQPRYYFKPTRAGDLKAETEEVFSWVAQKAGLNAPTARAGTLIIDGQPVHGVFVRNFEGEKLASVTVRNPGMRHALAPELGEDLPMRIFAKDWDPHAGNFKVGSDGRFAPFDRDNGVLIDNMPLINKPDAMRKAMVEELQETFWSAQGVGTLRHYWDVGQMHKNLTWNHVSRTIENIEAIKPDAIAAKVNAMTGLDKVQKQQAIQTLLARQQALRGAVGDYLEWLKTKPLPKMPPGPAQVAPPWLRQPVIQAPPLPAAIPQ
jgi:hypothetical protein